jgi:hypothetical protein
MEREGTNDGVEADLDLDLMELQALEREIGALEGELEGLDGGTAELER